MKKYILNAVALSLFTFAIVSCEEDRVTYNDADFVTFADASSDITSIPEEGGISEIPVYLSKTNNSDVVVNFTIENVDAVAGTDYNLISQSITIPAGQKSASIMIEAIDNDLIEISKSFTITITGTSIPGIQVGIVDVGSYKKTIVIANDDCPTNYKIFFGDLDIEDVGSPLFTGTAAGNSTGDCDVLVVTADLPAAGIGAVPFNFFFTPDFEGATTGTVNVPSQVYCEGCVSGGTLDALYSGTGTYDETTKTITIDYALKTSAGGNIFTGTNIIIKQP